MSLAADAPRRIPATPVPSASPRFPWQGTAQRLGPPPVFTAAAFGDDRPFNGAPVRSTRPRKSALALALHFAGLIVPAAAGMGGAIARDREADLDPVLRLGRIPGPTLGPLAIALAGMPSRPR